MAQEGIEKLIEYLIELLYYRYVVLHFKLGNHSQHALINAVCYFLNFLKEIIHVYSSRLDTDKELLSFCHIFIFNKNLHYDYFLTHSAFGGISSAECVLCNHGTSLKSVSAYNPVEINTSLFTVYNFIAWRLCME